MDRPHAPVWSAVGFDVVVGAVAVATLATRMPYLASQWDGGLEPIWTALARAAVLLTIAMPLLLLATGAGLLLRRPWARPLQIACAAVVFFLGGLFLQLPVDAAWPPWTLQAVAVALQAGALAVIAFMLSRSARAWVGREPPASASEPAAQG